MVILTDKDADFIALQLREILRRCENDATQALKKADFLYTAFQSVDNTTVSKTVLETVEKEYQNAVSEIKFIYNTKQTVLYKCLELLTEGSIQGGLEDNE